MAAMLFGREHAPATSCECSSCSSTPPHQAGDGSVVGKDAAVTVRKDDVPAAIQAAINNVAALVPFTDGGGLIQTTSG